MILLKENLCTKLGEILNTDWGYDQTNVEFFKVKKVLGKKFFLVQELKSDVKETGFMSGTTTPTKEPKGESIKAHCGKGGYMKISGKMDGRSLYKWDGKPRRVSWYA